MASIEIKAISVCTGGEHVKLQLSVNGSVKAVIDTEAAKVLANLSQEDADAVAIMLARLAGIGRTKAQTKTALLAGITVTF